MLQRRNTHIPLYEEVKNWIREYIVRNDLMAGEMLPSERELCEKLNVSRITVVKAMNDLAADGIAIRVQGKGTMVRDLPARTSVNVAKSFHEAICEQGYQESSRIVDFQYIDNIRARAIFGTHWDRFVKITRLRYINNSPAVLVKSIMEKDIGEKVYEAAQVNSELSYYRLIEEIVKEPVIKNELNVHITQKLEIADSKLLKVSSQSPHFYITSISYLRSSKPIEIVDAIFRGDIFCIHASNSNFYIIDQALS